MPKASQRSEPVGVRDQEVAEDVARALGRLVDALNASGHSLEDVYQSFRELDVENRGALSSSVDVATLFRAFLPSRERKQINFAAISTQFATRRGRFEYESFFKRLIAIHDGNGSTGEPPREATVSSAPNPSPSKRKAAKSAVSSPTKREQWVGRLRASGAGQACSSESDAQPAALPTMRIDRLLALQQQLQAGIRKKLLLGMDNGRRDGYLGVEDALFQLDADGSGFLPLRVFIDDILGRLSSPLTKSEVDFLVAQLQTHGKVSDEQRVDYEQLRFVFDVNSDDTASESGVDAHGLHTGSCPSPARFSQLGAEYLAAEKRLGEFLRGPLSSNDSSTVANTALETPRSVYTGAERFLELAEAVDKDKSGTLDEKSFGSVLAKCGVHIPDHLVLSMLSRFPREKQGRVSYSAFLHRHGQNPEQARGRRELKERVMMLVARVRLPVSEWSSMLHQRFRAYDATLESSKRGALVPPEFLRILSRHCDSTQVPSEQAAPISRVLTRLSPDKLIRYHEFLQVVSECPELPSKCVKSDATQAGLPEPGESISVGDYLMSIATCQERRNFEQLMDLLNDFQQQIASSGAEQGRLESRPMPNGIVMALGKQLKVQIQFQI